MRSILSISTLLLGVGLLLAGHGLTGTLLGVRGNMEGFSSSTLGLIQTGYYTGFVLGTLMVPRMIATVGHVRSLAALASLCSITLLLHGLWPAALFWMLIRTLAGACMVGIYIVIESWLQEQTTNEQRGHIFSAYMTITFLGMGIGQLLLLTGDIQSMQLFALASVLMSAGLIPVALTRVKEPPIVEAQRLGLARIYRTSPTGFIGAVFAGLGTGAFWGLGPVMAVGIGMEPSGVAGFMAITILGSILMLWPIGRMSDRFDRRTVLIWVCVLAGLSALIALWLIGIRTELVMIGGALYGATGFSIYAISASHTNDHIEPEHMVGAASSLQLLYAMGAIIGPVLAGVLMQWTSPRALLPFMATAAFLPAAFIRWRMSVRGPVPDEQRADWVPQMPTSPAALEAQLGVLSESDVEEEGTAGEEAISEQESTDEAPDSQDD